MNKKDLIILFILFSCVMFSQTYTGKVLDSQSLPIAYADVTVLSKDSNQVIKSIMTEADGSITGKIVGQMNEPIEYAEVIIQTLNSICIKSEFTNKNGNFNIIGIPSGNYELVVQYFSENVYSKIIKVEGSLNLGTILVDVGIILREVIIISEMNVKKELGKYVVSNISASPLAKNKNSYDFLGTIPLLENSTDGNSITINNRKEAKILINGKEVGNNEIALNILKSISAESIKRIEIISNPSSNYSADTQTGIINIFIKKSDEGLKGVFSVGTNQSYYNSQNVNSSFSYSKNNWHITTGVGLSNILYKLKENKTYKDYVNHRQTQIDYNSIAKNLSITPFININYDINLKQSIGVQFNSALRNSEVINKTSNYYSSVTTNSFDSLNIATIHNKNPNFRNLFFNVNYTLKTDSLGSNIVINAYNYTLKNHTQVFNDFYWTNQSQSILQKPDIGTNLYKIVADYTQNFKNDDVLKLGVNYNYGITKNDFFHGNRNGNEYISDSLRSNEFEYYDNTLSAYLVYQKILGDNLETELGLRWENYKGKGVSNDITTQKNNYIFPSISVLFYTEDNSEFSLDYRSSIIRPPYNYYNPNIYFTSANSYKKNNPNLLPILSHSLAFNYSFLKHYSFDIEYDYAKNIFNDFDIVQHNGLIETITDNYGKGHEIWLGFTYNNQFLKDRWNFTASLSYIYEKSKGIYNGIDLGFDNKEWMLKLKNYIYLNKGKNSTLNLIYGYGSSNRSILGEMNAMHSLTLELNKSYKNFNFTLGAYDLLRSNVELRENRAVYSFYKNRKYYKTAYFRLNYFFGNRKVKKVNNKQDKINDRIQ